MSGGVNIPLRAYTHHVHLNHGLDLLALFSVTLSNSLRPKETSFLC